VRLLGIEIRRAFARRVTKGVILLGLLGIIAAGASVFFTSRRTIAHEGPPPARIAQFKQEVIQECVNGGSFPGPQPVGSLPAVGSAEREAACTNAAENLEFGATVDKRFHLTQLADILQHVSAFGAILAWLLGASLIGAEWRSGSMTTLLTWEPRRTRVMVAKGIAAVFVSFIVVMVLQGLLVGSLFPAAYLRGSTAGTTTEFWRQLSYMGLRSGGLAALAALTGFALASLGRNTAASLGVGFFYAAVIEGAVVGNFVPKARPWLLVRNAVVFIVNHRVEFIPNRTPEQAGLILLGYAVALFLISVVVTRARDVT
jgi:hypothetical protein